MAIIDRVTTMVLPLLEPLDLRLYDVEISGSTLRITVDGDAGVNLDQVAAATRAISRAFDDDDPMPGGYTLEVSSPGLERKLRTPEHFEGAIGDIVNVKLGPHVLGERRIRGELTALHGDIVGLVDEEGEEHEVALADITKAVTVFEWGPTPKPGSAEAKKGKQVGKAKPVDKAKQVGTGASTTPDAEDSNRDDATGMSGRPHSERRAAAQ